MADDGRRKMSDKDRELASRLYTEMNLTMEQVARVFEVSQPHITKLFKKMGIKTRTGGPPSSLDEDDERLILDLFMGSDMTAAAVVKATGLPEHSVYKVLRAAGVYERRPNRIGLGVRAEIEELLSEKQRRSYSEVANIMGVSKGSVAAIAMESGLNTGKVGWPSGRKRHAIDSEGLRCYREGGEEDGRQG